MATIQQPRPTDSTTPTQRDLAFKTFGVLDAGKQDTKSTLTAIVLNSILLLLALIAGRYAKKVITAPKETVLIAPVEIKKPEPPPPPKLPKPPIVKVEPPKIKVPTIEVPEPPKIPPPPVMKPAPVPIMQTPAPKAVTPPPAPKPVNIQIAQAASVANNDPHPSAIRLGNMTNPINNTAGPAVSPVNLGRSGAPGMNAGNTGLGKPSSINIAGSGSPNGTNLNGTANAVKPIKGLSNGVTGGTGTGPARPGVVAIARNEPPAVVRPTVAPPSATPKKAPRVLFKPKPIYTEEAKRLRIEGTVAVRIHVSASGAVQVLGVQSGLGHGLDQAALNAAQNMRFEPATQDGHAVDWDGVVTMSFQLADNG